MAKWTLNQSWLATLLVGANIAAFAVFAVQRLSAPPRSARVTTALKVESPIQNCVALNTEVSNSREAVQPVFSYVETQPEIVVASVDGTVQDGEGLGN